MDASNSPKLSKRPVYFSAVWVSFSDKIPFIKTVENEALESYKQQALSRTRWQTGLCLKQGDEPPQSPSLYSLRGNLHFHT